MIPKHYVSGQPVVSGGLGLYAAAADCRSRRPAPTALAKITDKAKRARKQDRQGAIRSGWVPFPLRASPG
ncbi:hypothetical protein MGWOODY_Smn111 [hydrothermal vent metagenome]|uniref:Uncharacterized protein n=1 Tax=hydrothermal vent metagenome TaxID=652676 RepID=A0A161K0M5_9ZZZZ